MLLDLKQNISTFDHQMVMRAWFEKKRAIISRSLDYSLQLMKPFCLKYVRRFSQRYLLTPVVKIESIKIMLTNYKHIEFKLIIEELMKTEWIMHPNNNSFDNNWIFEKCLEEE